jgi:hypothetical protein
MSKSSESLSGNSNQVRDAERRLAIQHTFIDRLRATGKDTRSAEKTLEVMRDILRELYLSRSLLRRRILPQNRMRSSPARRKNTDEKG